MMLQSSLGSSLHIRSPSITVASTPPQCISKPFKSSAKLSTHDTERRLLLKSSLPPAFTLLFVSTDGPALALTGEDIAEAFSKVQAVSQQVTNTAESVYEITKSVAENIFVTLKPAINASLPYVKKVTDTSLQVLVPIASDVATKANEVLKSAGVDTKPVIEVTKTAVMITGKAVEKTGNAIEVVKPMALNTAESLLVLDPLILAGGAGSLVVFYLIAPSLFSLLAYVARGYKGNLSAPQALDLLTKENCMMIDVRSEEDKSKSGVPSLPRNAKNKLFSLPVEELPSKLKPQLKNANKVEAELTAIKIAYLKMVNRSSKLLLLDSYGDIGKVVARSLTDLGFKNIWVITDGFSGGKGWVQSRLGTDTYKTKITVLSPSRVIPDSNRRLFRTTPSDVVDVAPRFAGRLLPGGSDE